MTTKAKGEPVVVDLDSLLAAIDAPARARAEQDAQTALAEAQASQAAAATWGAEVVKRFTPIDETWAGWSRTTAGVDFRQLKVQLPEPVVRALDHVGGHSASIERLVRQGQAARKLVTELTGPLLPPARRSAIVAELRNAHGATEGWASTLAIWTRLRVELAEQQSRARQAQDVVDRIVVVSAEDRAAYEAHQERLAAAALPPIPPRPPRRGVPGANFDAPTSTSTQARRPLLENLEDDL